MSRYEQDIRRSTRRRDTHTTVPRGWVAGMMAVIVLMAVVAFVSGTLWERYQRRKGASDTATVTTSGMVRHDSMTSVSTYNGEMIRFYVMTDPDYQVQYIVNDRGGMCVRERSHAQ